MRFSIVIIFVFHQFHGLSQAFTNWIVGDTTDLQTQSFLGIVVLEGSTL
jgi:hypothetical protein